MVWEFPPLGKRLIMKDEVRASIRDYGDFLDGREVTATIIGRAPAKLAAGDTVIAFKHTIAAESEIAVPRSQQSHYIGVEASVVDVHHDGGSNRPTLVVRKL